MTLLTDLGIATCQVTYGKEASFAGTNASVAIAVTAKAVGISQLQLVWDATGDMLTAFTDSSSAAAGAAGVIVLPQTGQDGFVQGGAGGSVAVKDWYYQAVVTSTIGRTTMKRTYNFQIPAGTTTLDLDRLPINGQVTIPTSQASNPYVTAAEVAATYVHFGPTLPTLPTGTEYVWNKTDGAGTLLDIVSGVA